MTAAPKVVPEELPVTPPERYGERLLSPDSSGELPRITALEAIADDDTIRCLEKIPLGPGARCLEIGAGAGSVASWLADVVGPVNVTATDVDTRFLAPLAQAGINVVRHNVVTDPAPEDKFDLIHVRHVLEHLPSRDELIARLASWLTDGGWLVVEAGFHIHEIAAHPAHARQKAARAQLLADKIGTDLTWAVTLPAPLTAAGLTDIQLQGSLRPCLGATGSSDFDRLTLLSMSDDLVESGLLSRAEIDEALELYDDPAFVDYSAGAVAAWGRRPPRHGGDARQELPGTTRPDS
jgi:SAM-dependent methyltransferase